MKKKIVCIIQARISSSRLPGKIFLSGQKNKSMLLTLYSRIKPSKYISNIVIATTKKKSDNLVFNECKKNNIAVFRGSESNVLKRYFDCAKKYKAKTIIRLTSDCPLLEYNLIDKLLVEFKKNKCDYLSNVHPATFPDGYDVEIFSFDALKEAHNNAIKDFEKEHVTPYIWDNPKKFLLKNYSLKKNYSSKYRLTLDYLEDYFLIKEVFNYFSNKKNYFSVSDVINYLKKNKEIITNKKYLLVNWYRHHIEKLKTVKSCETIDIKKKKNEKFK